MNVKIEDSWKNVLEEEFKKDYFAALANFVKKAYQKKTVYPHPSRIFSAFNICPFEHVKVVILGQDPYHGSGQANGMSFSVNKGVRIPPSLSNIYKEIESDTGKQPPKDGDLTSWAKQGVLLLNATLTVQSGKPGSHQGIGWEEFTDAVIEKLSSEKAKLVFLLWGAYARDKGSKIDRKKHLVLETTHPSPFSADKGFLGSRHFSKTNTYLIVHDKEPINW